MANTASDVLSIARGEIGYSRWTDPETGTKYGRWYAQDHGAYYGENGVPYCAMFTSWVFDQAGAYCAGLPEAYCPYILNEARNAGAVLASKYDAQPGDVVLFDWDGGVVDHVGIVEKNYGNYIQCIEGNTSSGAGGSQDNGGGVYRRTRDWGVVKAVIRPSYSSSPSEPSEPSTPSTNTLTVDGWLGVNSITEWQTQLGCEIVDGKITGQAPENKTYLANVTSISYEDDGGSDMVQNLQKFLVNKGYSISIDRYIGTNTVTAIQKYMRDYCGYVRHAIDGYLGPNTAANIQNALNAGYFKV